MGILAAPETKRMSTALLLIPVVGILGLVWFVLDMKFAQRWSLRRAELGAQDNWRELNAHFESALKCSRPMLLLFQRFVIPGLFEADFALHLSNQGEHERALQFARMASRKSARRADIQLAVRPAESTILLRLGRYEEARAVIQHCRRLLESPTPELEKAMTRPDLAAGVLVQEGLMEYNLGNLDAALKSGLEASVAVVSDPARALVSAVLCTQGRFKEALDALVYEPSGFHKFLDDDALDLLDKDKSFQKTAQKLDEEVAGVFGPAIAIGRAQVFLETEDADNLGQSLQQAQDKLKSHKIMEHIFVRVRACWNAMSGDEAAVESDLAWAWRLADDKPASRSAKYETHVASGRAHLLLGQHDTAIRDLSHATQLALHPLEKHTSLYWLARANQAANRPEAAIQYNSVVADGFGTWMEADARQRLG